MVAGPNQEQVRRPACRRSAERCVSNNLRRGGDDQSSVRASENRRGRGGQHDVDGARPIVENVAGGVPSATPSQTGTSLTFTAASSPWEQRRLASCAWESRFAARSGLCWGEKSGPCDRADHGRRDGEHSRSPARIWTSSSIRRTCQRGAAHA
jgi:hypothetical protein